MMIQRGEADAVLVVGVDCLSECVVAGFTALKALDPSGCRQRSTLHALPGLSPGEAGAAIVLAREDWVPQPAVVRVRGCSGGSNDANHLTPARLCDGSGLAQAIRMASQCRWIDTLMTLTMSMPTAPARGLQRRNGITGPGTRYFWRDLPAGQRLKSACSAIRSRAAGVI